MHDHFKTILGFISTAFSYLFGRGFQTGIFDLNNAQIDTVMQRLAYTCTYILFGLTIIHLVATQYKKYRAKHKVQ